MLRIIEVEHRTLYQYSSPVEQSWQLARLQPRTLPHQRLLAHALSIDPTPDWQEARTDSFGNPACAFSLHGGQRPRTRFACCAVAVGRAASRRTDRWLGGRQFL
jgi:transglutaminase-like putative cysteine protease